jgi:hypothetical protein
LNKIANVKKKKEKKANSQRRQEKPRALIIHLSFENKREKKINSFHDWRSLNHKWSHSTYTAKGSLVAQPMIKHVPQLQRPRFMCPPPSSSSSPPLISPLHVLDAMRNAVAGRTAS